MNVAAAYAVSVAAVAAELIDIVVEDYCFGGPGSAPTVNYLILYYIEFFPNFCPIIFLIFIQALHLYQYY